jgi:hypothetical protein
VGVAGPASAAPRTGPSAAPAKVLIEQSLIAGNDKVTTTTGVKLDLSLDAFRLPNTGATVAGVFVDVATIRDTEEHAWNFRVVGADALKVNSSSSGSLKTGTAIAPYGSVSLSFAKVGTAKRIDVCNASNYTLSQPERVKGTFFFDTRSRGRHAWGKVGSRTTSFKFTGTPALESVYTSNGCQPSTPLACSTDVSWQLEINGGHRVGQAPGVEFYGNSLKPATIDALRLQMLSRPMQATRADFVEATSPAPVLITEGTTRTLKVTTSGTRFHGSGALVSRSAGDTSKSKCKGGTETETTWRAKFTPGASTLSATEQIFGTIKLPKVVGRAQIARNSY